jgi:hypothetical protein
VNDDVRLADAPRHRGGVENAARKSLAAQIPNQPRALFITRQADDLMIFFRKLPYHLATQNAGRARYKNSHLSFSFRREMSRSASITFEHRERLHPARENLFPALSAIGCRFFRDG